MLKCEPNTRRVLLSVLATCLYVGGAGAAQVGTLRQVNDDWFSSEKGKTALANIITWQNANGGWWKAYDVDKPRNDAKPEPEAPLPPGAPKSDGNDSWHKTSTIDNNATYTELRLLARGYTLTKNEAYKASFDKGLKFLFDAQYPNGGWPQRFPLEKNYGSHITYNDDAMTGVMQLLFDIVNKKPEFAFVDEATREKAKESFDRSVDCTLKCQIKVNGKPTIWCQQHDEVTFAPTNARAYELPSFSTSESATLTLLLMSIENPSPALQKGIEGAVAWFDANKIVGKKMARLEGPEYEGGKERKVVDDPTAPPMWARFYDLETSKPYFSDRDGVKKDSLDQIGHERRVGYAWYGNGGNKVLEQYHKWKAKLGNANNTK